jgi:RluA family pseudouridine synthase
MLPDWMQIRLSDEVKTALRRHLRYPGRQETSLHYPVRIVAPYDFTHEFRVKPQEVGQSVIGLLTTRFPFRDAQGWLQKISEGNIQLNGNLTNYGAILQQNDRLSHRNIAVIEPSIPDDIRIIYQNDQLLLIDKPAPMPVHAGGRYNKNTAISVLADMGHSNLHVVHRLDAVTAGILLFAKNNKSANILKDMFINGYVHKFYEAIVRGVPAEDEVTISVGIKRKQGIEFMCSEDADSKPAITRFKVLERGIDWARVGCEPVTGRTHQIRLHLQKWGYPIWDDPLYGSDVAMQNRPISLVSMHLGFSLPEN